MERDIDALRGLLSTASSTLTSFQTVRLVDRQEGSGGNRQQSSANLSHYNAFGSTATATSLRGLKLPEWLDKAPTELEELLLERKHDVAVKLIRQVKGFAANVRNATNLGQGVAAIFAQADDMAAALSRRLISEITGSNTFTAWGFREHKKNFQLLIDLGYADAAAAAFVKERSSLIRRALHMVSTLLTVQHVLLLQCMLASALSCPDDACVSSPASISCSSECCSCIYLMLYAHIICCRWKQQQIL
jgi:Exocyst component 84 C-terminal